MAKIKSSGGRPKSLVPTKTVTVTLSEYHYKQLVEIAASWPGGRPSGIAAHCIKRALDEGLVKKAVE